MRGWIFDLYPGQPGEMVVWMKDADGRAHRLVDSWAPSFYVASNSQERLVGLSVSPGVQRYAARTELVQRRERITDRCESAVLKVTMRDAAKMLELARVIERESAFGDPRIYNCDVPPGQSYMYERDIFPLALCDVREGPYGLRWALDDDTREYDYALPPLRTMSVGVRGSRSGLITKADDPGEEVWLEDGSGREVIGGASEREKILGLAERVRELDLDILLTRDGDRFLFPYLIARAERNGVAELLVLGRDPVALKLPDRAGTSYFSYGKVLFKPSSMRIYGRLHLDTSVSFSHSHSGLSGLFEISRVCMQPLHTSSRASIGKALSSLQFYHATKQGILIPWKPTLAERFKSRSELLVADRGGFIYEPLAGVYDDVAEFDFASLYPNIMRKKNISAETVKCGCCPDSGEVVPELGWNVCEKRKGITSKAMEVIVEKRLEYKRRKGSAKGELKERYQGCQDALKWLGVCSFGYLGFNNAKFGRIDAHIAVCAWDRDILLRSVRIAEREGFRVIHGIVDSLWLKKAGATRDDYQRLKEEIERETGFDLSFEGVYNWIAFLNSRTDPRLPVQNRYFGVYSDGATKIRGIESRRHDTPEVFRGCQDDILKVMKDAGSVDEVRTAVPACVNVFRRYAEAIRRKEVPVEAMVFTKNISKEPGGYRNDTLEAGVVKALLREGAALHQGENVSYVITDFYSRGARAIPSEALDGRRCYDASRYVELLSEVCATLLEPFDAGMTSQGLLDALTADTHGRLA